MSGLLEGRRGLIVGASSGIGRASAKLFAEEGADIVIVARRNERLDELVAEYQSIGGKITPFCVDITAKGAPQKVTDFATTTLGRIDFAFNNAGTIGNFIPIVEQSEADFDEVMAVNLKSVWLSVRSQAQQMMKQERGVIVNTSSWLSRGALLGSSTYSASKSALDGLMRACALEFAPHIRINNINPGGIDTEMTRIAFNHDEQVLLNFGNSHPIGRMGTSLEVAQLAAFLFSDRASNITGQAIAVDGGYAIPGQRG